MKKIHLYSFLLLLCWGVTSCYDNDDIEDTNSFNLLEFTFPQGDNPWDKEIEQIAKDWGMYIIYKDVDEAALNKGWADHYYNEPVYSCTTPSDEDVQLYLKLVKDWLLGSLDKTNEADRQQLPLYLYIVNDFKDSNPNSPSNGKHVMLKKDGMDYWSLSFLSEELQAGLSKEQIHKVACAFSYPGMVSRFESGEYQIAEGFAALSDYETPIGTRYYSLEQWLEDNPWMEGQEEVYEMMTSAHERDEVNAYKHRGFLPTVREDFRLAADLEDPMFPTTSGAPTWMPWIPDVYGDDLVDYNPGPVAETVEERIFNDFLNTIRYAMVRSKEAISQEFPLEVENQYMKEGYGIIHQKYDMVVKHLKDNYNIDLTKYAEILK